MTALVRGQSLAGAKFANNSGVTRAPSGTKRRPLDGRIALVAKALWIEDRAKSLAKAAKCHPRTAKRYLAGGAISFGHFLNLLRTDYGDKFLDAYLADAEPKWWRHRKNIQDLARAKKAALAALKRAEQLEIEFAADD